MKPCDGRRPGDRGAAGARSAGAGPRRQDGGEKNRHPTSRGRGGPRRRTQVNHGFKRIV
jgi:hypothetical protein